MPNKQMRKSNKELLELGKQLQHFYEMGYVNPARVLWFSFIKGMVTGFGAFLGGTIVVTIFAAVLSKFHQLPFIPEIINAIRHSN